ncbi:MAG: NAD(+)/NADH kinase [Pseudomonadota bacterium]
MTKCRTRRDAVRLGLVVNPIAGLGGAVGLKGTDGPDTVAEARRRGGVARAGERAYRAMAQLAARAPGTVIAVAADDLGESWVSGLDLAPRGVAMAARSGTARDTRAAVAAMPDVDLILFAGGDGTARDVAAALGHGQAMLGIPCGVKMHSGVFAVSPEAAGAMAADLVSASDRIAWDDMAEIMDIDEAALRAGQIAPKLFGHARAPVARNRVQAAKGGPRINAANALRGAAAEVAETMEPGTLYIIGPGSSAGSVMRALGHEPNLLGIDAVRDGAVVARDARASELEDIAGEGPVKIVLGVTGQQGFLLGRGNQQISAPLIARAGRDGLILLATEDKLARLAQPRLWVDTGQPDLDRDLTGFARVRTGRAREMVMRIGVS